MFEEWGREASDLSDLPALTVSDPSFTGIAGSVVAYRPVLV